MKRNIVVYTTILIIISSLISGCRATPLSLTQDEETKTFSLKIIKNSRLISDIKYDYSIFELKGNARSSDVFYQKSDKIPYGEDSSYTFENVPYGCYTVTVSAYLKDVAEPVYKSSEDVDVTSESVTEDGAIIQNIAIEEEDLAKSTSDEEEFFNTAITVEFADADGSAVTLGADGFYTFRKVNGPEGHIINASITPKDSSASYTYTWSIGDSTASNMSVYNVSGLKSGIVNETEGIYFKLPGATDSNRTAKFGFYYLRDENGTSNGYTLRLRVTDSSSNTSYEKDYKILCKDDPYSPLVYLAVGEMAEVELSDKNSSFKTTAEFLKYNKKTGGRSGNTAKTAWLFYFDASHDLYYYLSDNHNECFEYTKYQANAAGSLFWYEWGYKSDYLKPTNISSTSSKDMNNKILSWGTDFTAADESRTTIWTALLEFRDRYAAGLDRYSIPNHRSLSYVYDYKDKLDKLSKNNCPEYWCCDQANLVGLEYMFCPHDDYSTYARVFSFRDKGIRAVPKNNPYIRTRLVLELPVFDITGGLK